MFPLISQFSHNQTNRSTYRKYNWQIKAIICEIVFIDPNVNFMLIVCIITQLLVVFVLYLYVGGMLIEVACQHGSVAGPGEREMPE